MKNTIEKAEQYVRKLLREQLPTTFFYHNINHTVSVVAQIEILCKAEKTTLKNTQIVLLAGWFHDVGFIKGTKQHEKDGVAIAKTFLETEKITKPTIEKIVQCILATQKEVEPTTILEKIICDADCSHLANKNYSNASDLLREEWEQQDLATFTEKGWIEENIDFLANKHQYYTKFAQENWQSEKSKNLVRLIKSLKKQKQEESKALIKEEELRLKKIKANTPERGIETMFRVTLKNHITLSDIADTKANILLSVNAIIISMALSNLIPKLDNPSNGYLIFPTIIFVVFSLISMALSVLATRPNVTSGKFTKEDVKQKKVNLLFFGNFHKMKLDEFEWAMGEMMKDKDYLYSSLKKDLYFLGLVLHKKYKILRYTYTIFLAGIILSVIAFAIAFRSQSLG